MEPEVEVRFVGEEPQEVLLEVHPEVEAGLEIGAGAEALAGLSPAEEEGQEVDLAQEEAALEEEAEAFFYSPSSHTRFEQVESRANEDSDTGLTKRIGRLLLPFHVATLHSLVVTPRL